MRTQQNQKPGEHPQNIAISSLVDVAFLLLIYFLVTSTLHPRESDLDLGIGGSLGDSPRMAIDYLPISLQADGSIHHPELNLESGTTGALALSEEPNDFRTACNTMDCEAVVSLDLNGGARHQNLIQSLNELTRAGITDIRILDNERI